MEADEINVLAGAVLGDLEEVDDAEESGFAGKGGGDIGEADGLDGIDFDFAFLHAVTGADADVEAFPDADGASDLAAADGVAKALGEGHGESVIRRTRAD